LYVTNNMNTKFYGWENHIVFFETPCSYILLDEMFFSDEKAANGRNWRRYSWLTFNFQASKNFQDEIMKFCDPEWKMHNLDFGIVWFWPCRVVLGCYYLKLYFMNDCFLFLCFLILERKSFIANYTLSYLLLW